MQVQIITPESKIFQGEAEAVQLPGLDGSFQVLANHAPIISALVEGEVKVNLTQDFVETDGVNDVVYADGSNKRLIRVKIKGGVMEMLNNKVIVLAE